IIMLLMVIAFGVFGGALAVEGIAQRQVTIYPSIPAPAPETLNFVPSVQTFPDTGTCADPTAPVAGWEKGIGGQLPPCWATWSREQQNAFLRSH
ncbi:MAG: hypothetical protein ABI557_11555, partial [Aureliella sp.]